MCERTLVLKFSGVTILIVQGPNQSNGTPVMKAKRGKCAAVSQCWFYPYIIQDENTRLRHVRVRKGEEGGCRTNNSLLDR